ncbi:MAG: hypothetical protein ACI4QD_00455 [Kiritimatiellia bacterium]
MKKRLNKKQAAKNRKWLAGVVSKVFRSGRGEPAVCVEKEVPASRPPAVAIIYRSELDFISRCILDRRSIETGGELFGFWTGNGVPVVLYAIGPGAHANHQAAFFNQDVDYLVTIGKRLIARYGLQHIGEWHSHHQLGLARPSGHDASTMVNSIRKLNLGRFLLAIGNCTATASTLNAFAFTQSCGYDYVHAAWEIKECESPFRARIDADPEFAAILRHPETPTACHGVLKTVAASGEFVAPAYARDYWLKDRANNLALKEIVDYLSGRSVSGRCDAQLDGCGQVQLSLSDGGAQVRVVFLAGFPEIPPLVSFDGVEAAATKTAWVYSGEIVKSFVQYYESLKGETAWMPSAIKRS